MVKPVNENGEVGKNLLMRQKKKEILFIRMSLFLV